MSSPLLQGWLMMAGLIVAIGAQNALVLRQGLARQHVGVVVLLCTVCDWLLTALGVFGLGGLIRSSPLLLEGFRWGGAAFLVGYGALAARRAWRGGDAALQAASGQASLASTVGSTLALTFLNPHVYLDTVVLMGSVGAQLPGPQQWQFAVGAGLASLMWFATLGSAASAAARFLQRPAVWRGIDATVALVMFTIAWQLLREGQAMP